MTPRGASSFTTRRVLDLMGAWSSRAAPRTKPRRLLVTSSGGLGDGVLLSSAVQHLQAADSTIAIGILAWFGARRALAALPRVYVHREYGLPRRTAVGWAIIRELRACHYDTVLATDHTALSIAVLLRLAGIPRRIGFAPIGAASQARLYTDVINLDESESQWSLLLKLARLAEPKLGSELEVTPLPITARIDEEIEQWWRTKIPPESRPVAAIHLGAGAAYRRWPVARFVEVAERLRKLSPAMMVLLTGRNEERELIEEFSRNYGGGAIDISRFRSLQEAAAILRRCDLLISNDSGIMHLGAAMGAPTVGLFGPSAPRQWAPRGPRVSYVYARGIPCSPCMRVYRGPAPSACANPIQQQCFLAISADDVLQAVKRMSERWR